jgi:hypothetical protein
MQRQPQPQPRQQLLPLTDAEQWPPRRYRLPTAAELELIDQQAKAATPAPRPDSIIERARRLKQAERAAAGSTSEPDRMPDATGNAVAGERLTRWDTTADRPDCKTGQPMGAGNGRKKKSPKIAKGSPA